MSSLCFSIRTLNRQQAHIAKQQYKYSMYLAPYKMVQANLRELNVNYTDLLPS